MNRTICGLRCAHPYIKFLVAVMLAAATGACDKEGFEYNMPGTEQPSSYIVTDTLTINMQTALLDSIPTSGTNTILCGRYQDPYLGTVTAGSFFQLQLPANKTLDATARYDSVELILYTNHRLYGDSSQLQHINVYEVQQTIRKAENNAYLYNNSNFLTGNQPIGSIQRVVRPNMDTVVKIKLPQSYGATLFQHFKSNDNIVSTQDIFLKTYMGLALKAGDNSRNILGFHTGDTAVILRMHYHMSEPIVTDRHLDLNLYNPDLQFNQVSADRAGTLLAGLSPTNKSIPSAQTANMSFVQPLSGIVTRIDLPGLKALASVGAFFKVMRATLTVEPVAGTYSSYYTLPPALTLCEADLKNNVLDTLQGQYGGAQYGNLVTDLVNHDFTTYTYDITHYVISEINSTESFSRGLLLIPPRSEYVSSFTRAVLGDQKHKRNRISIQVYYLRND